MHTCRQAAAIEACRRATPAAAIGRANHCLTSTPPPPPPPFSVPAGPSGPSLGVMPDPVRLLAIPTFTPAGGSTPGLDVLAAAALSQLGTQGTLPATGTDSQGSQPADGTPQLHAPGPYNPAAALPPKMVKRLLALEFVEMSELRADVWPDDPAPTDSSHTPRRPGRPPVINIKTWLECFARMAAVLVSRFPEKAPELWAYQSTILNVAHSYEGATWVAYDQQYRREMLARKDLNWSVPNSRLYNEAFTGRARFMPRCQHCLSEDHGSTGCPQHPNPMVVGWFQPPSNLPLSTLPSLPPPTLAVSQPKTPGQEVCRNFNNGRCRFSQCRFLH